MTDKIEQINKISIDITNHFFGLGAVISKKDYDYVVTQINQLLKEIRDEVMFRIDNYGGFEDDGGNLCHYDDEMKKIMKEIFNKYIK